MDYFITAREEVLREVAASIIANLSRYMVFNNIESDHRNPISLLLDKIYEISDSIISEPDHTMDDLEKISAKLSFAREYVDEVVSVNG